MPLPGQFLDALCLARLGWLAVAPGWGCGRRHAVVTGCAGVLFAAPVAGLLAAFVTVRWLLVAALSWAGGGGVYGLFVGWLVGLVSLAFRSRR